MGISAPDSHKLFMMSGNTIVIDEPTVWNDPEYNITGTVAFRSNLTIAGNHRDTPVRVYFASDLAVLKAYGESIHLENVEFYGDGGGSGLEMLLTYASTSCLDMPTFEITRLTCRGLTTCVTSGNDYIHVSESVFIGNKFALNGGSYNSSLHDSLFLNNVYAVANGITYIKNSMFVNNSFAIEDAVAVDMENTTFVRNYRAFRGFFSALRDILFYQNYAGLAITDWNLATVEGVTFRENQLALFVTYNTERLPSIIPKDYELNFIENEVHVRHNAKNIVSMKNLYWGSSNITEIRRHIVDIYLDPNLGLIDVEPVSPEPFNSTSLLLPPEEFLGYNILDGPNPYVTPSATPSYSPVDNEFIDTIAPSVSQTHSFPPHNQMDTATSQKPSSSPTIRDIPSTPSPSLSEKPTLWQQSLEPSTFALTNTPSPFESQRPSFRATSLPTSTDMFPSVQQSPSVQPTTTWNSAWPSMTPSVDLLSECRQELAQYESSPVKSTTSGLLYASVGLNLVIFAVLGSLLALKFMRRQN